MDSSLSGSSVHGILEWVARQEHWSRLPFPSSGDLPDQGIKPTSPAMTGGFFTTQPPGKPSLARYHLIVVPGRRLGSFCTTNKDSLVKRETEAHTLIFFKSLFEQTLSQIKQRQTKAG